MPFVKGMKKVPGSGRKPGTKNIVQPIIRKMLTEFTNTEEFWDRFYQELDALEGKDYINGCKVIFDVVEPKLSAIQAEITQGKADTPLLNYLRELSENAQG